MTTDVDVPATHGRFGIVTDSNSQITPDLIERFDVEVVPLTVTIDGRDHLEGVDLDADAFYAHFDDGHTPEIATSQPSPGAFAEAYERLARRGYDQIVSIHLATAMSGTAGTAELAAHQVSMPVEVVDTSTASFGVAACVWAVGAAREQGASAGAAVQRLHELESRTATAFMIGVPMLTEQGGRAADISLDGDGIPIIAMADGAVDVIDRVNTTDEATAAMVDYATAWSEREPRGVTVAIGTADEPSRPLTAALEDALAGAAGIDRVVHYRVGPSVGAHTGPGTFGLFVFPTID
jgi:DegV family protein with EDD domain